MKTADGRNRGSLGVANKIFEDEGENPPVEDPILREKIYMRGGRIWKPKGQK